MVDSEYRTGGYKSSKTSIVAMIKSPEMLKFVTDYIKTEN